MDHLKWNVLLPRGDSYIYNIFDNLRFREALMDLKYRAVKSLKHITFKEELKKILIYCFWCKAEYEILIKGFLSTKEEIKIDIYTQLLLNLEHLQEYLLINWGYIPAKSYTQQRKAKWKLN